MTWGSGAGYAPESLLDRNGRRIMWAALYDRRTIWGDVEDLVMRHGWDGVLTMPRVLTLDEYDNLIMEPVEELRSLRTDPVVHNNLSLNDSELRIDNINGDALELEILIKPNDAKEFGLRVLCSPDGVEQTSISYNVETEVVRVDLSRTSLDSSLMRDDWFKREQEANLKLLPEESVNFHVFIDKSVLEIFVNGKLCLTHKVYPSLEESKGVRLFSVGGTIDIPTVNAWKMHPSNPW